LFDRAIHACVGFASDDRVRCLVARFTPTAVPPPTIAL